MEYKTAKDSGICVVAKHDGVVEKVYPKAKPDTNAEEILAYLKG